MTSGQFVPYTPGGSCLEHLASDTEAGAWANLLQDARHMPYKTQKNFELRGYTVEQLP